MTNERALETIEHAISHLSTIDGIFTPFEQSTIDAVGILYEAHKAIGPLGQIPSWERR